MGDVEDIRTFALSLERAYEAFVRGRRKFRVGSIVFVAFSHDEQIMGFGYPRLEREALVASDPETFLMPEPSDLKYNWVQARVSRLDPLEARELVVDAWRLCVPKKVSAAWDTAHPEGPS